jgi:type IV pilus assembly protein PilV
MFTMKTYPFDKQFARRFSLPKAQRGVLLIEAMCAILIFSFGILGLIGLQTAAVQQSGDANFRSTAGELADQLINQMWVSNRSVAASTLVTNFQSVAPAGAAYTAWNALVSSSLPGGTSVVTMQPQPAGCVPAVSSCSVIATVTVSWQTGHDAAQHNYVVSAQITEYP